MNERSYTTLTEQNERPVLEVKPVSPSAYLLRLERGELVFRPGQCVLIGLPGIGQMREYSIYSPADADYLEVLIKEVDIGTVSRWLKNLQAGDRVVVEGPVGYFTLDEEEARRRRFLFVASGTGVAPFHSMVTSWPELDYRLVHGVRYRTEAYGRSRFERGRYVLCTSRDRSGDFQGRVTDFLKREAVEPDTLCYLCGNARMIDAVHDLLEAQGVAADNIRAEVYF